MKTFSTLSRMIAFAVVLCLCAAFVPVMTFAADVTPGTITLDGTVINAENPSANGVTYDPETNVVTLTNVNGGELSFNFTSAYTVKLVGKNTLKSFRDMASTVPVTLEGPGSLTLVPGGGNWPIRFEKNTFIMNSGSIFANDPSFYTSSSNERWVMRFGGAVINGGTIISKGNQQPFAIVSAPLVVNGGTLSLNGADHSGISAGGQAVEINGGSVVLVSNANGIHNVAKGLTVNGGSLEVSAPSLVSAKTAITVKPAADIKFTTTAATINLNNSTVTDTGVVYVPGASFADNGNVIKTADYVTVDGQNMIVNGENPTLSLPVGEGTVSYDADTATVTLNNVTAGKILFNLHKDFNLNLVGENTVSSSAAKVVEVLSGNVTVDGDGTLTTEGTNEVIYTAGNYTQNGATILSNATGYGFLCAEGDITINGGTLTGTSPSFWGMHANGNIRISGGVVNAAANSNVIVTDATNLTIDGGTVTAKSNTAGALRSAGSINLLGGRCNLEGQNQALQCTTLNIDSDVKLTAKITGSPMTSGTLVLADGVRFVTGKAFADNSGEIETLVEGEKDYNLPGEGTIIVNVTLNDEADENREVQLWQGETLLDTQTASAEGNVFFKVNPVGEGEHVYTVKVVGENGNGYTFAEAQTVTVTVNNEGLATSEPVVLTNTYVAPTADVTLSATVNGNKADVQLILNGEVIDTITEANGVVNFATLTLEEGTYTFTVKQNAENGAGWTYDANEYTIVVTVADGTAIVEGEAIFTNTYDYVVDTDVTINVKVSVSDITLKAGDVTVTLTKGETVITGTIDAEGNVVLSIPASKDMAGVYTVSLSTEIKGITLPEAQTLTVEVKDNGDGTATVTATNTELTFNGSYKVPFAEGKIENGKYIVDETGKATEMGLIKIGEDYYYAGPNGVLVTGKYYAWLLNENCDIETGWYCFGADGKMLQGICEHPDKDGLYYFENGKPTEKGLFLYDGDYYVAQYDGKIITGKYYVWKIDESAKEAYTTGWYEFDENGVIVPLKNGIVDGKYYVDGKPTEMGLFEYEGDLYVAQYDGTIITGKYYVWKVQEGLEDLNGAWRYFGNDGKLLQGIVDGYYYVNGVRTEMGLFLNDDGHYYVAQYDGKIITSENYTKHGAGKYYVWKTTGCDELKGWQFFNADGQMIWKNNVVYSYEIPPVAAVYEGSPDVYNGSVFFDGVEYQKSFVEDGELFVSGLVNTPIYVNNNTNAAAYARTVLLIDNTNGITNKLHANRDKNGNNATWKTVVIGDKTYDVCSLDYGMIEAGENSRLGIYQFFWDKGLTDIADLEIQFINQLSADGNFEAITADYVAELFN